MDKEAEDFFNQLIEDIPYAEPIPMDGLLPIIPDEVGDIDWDEAAIWAGWVEENCD